MISYDALLEVVALIVSLLWTHWNTQYHFIWFANWAIIHYLHTKAFGHNEIRNFLIALALGQISTRQFPMVSAAVHLIHQSDW